ncbi:hypothetical protein SUGI_1497260 [Cryptomeria japonica]|uniref:Uncharacterized protein n=1 Tax=Cryptomeria japonica TaxID=3369 RepID=A0AAD3RRQ1_CRYJA|nr:hypothetical protein SUGI_1449880 [Cryptomeria japonica]GLJ59071.1 hypothetical protein SUGI_1491300 [Cryptomeria japonica]GLJ59199.1 hypothetical protein SUGI_1497260 [Cryptomeria japonica]
MPTVSECIGWMPGHWEGRTLPKAKGHGEIPSVIHGSPIGKPCPTPYLYRWMMEEPGGTVKRLEDLAKEGDSPVDWFPTPGVGGRRRGDSLDRAPRAPGGPTAPTI